MKRKKQKITEPLKKALLQFQVEDFKISEKLYVVGKNCKCDNSKTQIVTKPKLQKKLKNLSSDKTQKHKL